MKGRPFYYARPGLLGRAIRERATKNLATNLARRGNKRTLSAAEAKAKVVALVQQGFKVDEAMASVDRSPETYKDWRKNDLEFRQSIDSIRVIRKQNREGGRPEIPDFATFCAELDKPMYAHQLRMWEVINRQRPADLEQWPLIKYTEGTSWDRSEIAPEVPGGRVIVNGPPGFAKSTTFTVLWPLWLVCRNPNIRIILISKTQDSAIKQLARIKQYLESSIYREFQTKYAPEGGFKDNQREWSRTRIFVQGNDSGERDPTIEALGIGNQIFGARADLIILDDTVTLSNVNQYQHQMDWIDQEVESRLDGKGMLLLVNTRVAPVDLFTEMRAVTDADDNPVYSYFSQPALLSEGDGTPETWLSLWPEGFPPSRLRKMRRREDRWALVYQQQDVAEDATFSARAVEASINSVRFPGPMRPGVWGHRDNGMDGLYVVAGLDPAAAGHTAMIVGGIDRATGKRWIIDGFNHRNTSAPLLKETVKRLTEQHRINEWVIEANAFQRYLTQDEDLVAFLRGRGCKLTPHFTTAKNKPDPDFGVMSMAPLFLTCGQPPQDGGERAWKKTHDTALIELPSPVQNAWVQELINQLVVWQPSGMGQLQKTDLVMALWFFDIAARKILGHGRNKPTHMLNPYAPRNRASDRTVVNLADLRSALAEEGQVA